MSLTLLPAARLADQIPYSSLSFFEIPIVQPCHNVWIDAGSQQLENDIFLYHGTFPDVNTRVTAFSERFGNNNIVLCADPGEGDPFNYYSLEFPPLRNVLEPFLTDLIPEDGIARIYGAVQGGGRWKLTVNGASDSHSAISLLIRICYEEITDPQGLVPWIGPNGEDYWSGCTAF